MNVEERLIDSLVHDEAWGQHTPIDPVALVTAALRSRRRRRAGTSVAVIAAVATVVAVVVPRLHGDDRASIQPAGPLTSSAPTPEASAVSSAQAQALAAAAQAAAAAARARQTGAPDVRAHVVVSPAAGLRDGDDVVISVSGFRPNEKVFFSQCGPRAEPSPATGCGQQLAAEPFAVTDATGSAENVRFRVAATVGGAACTSSCSIAAVGSQALATAKMAFASAR